MTLALRAHRRQLELCAYLRERTATAHQRLEARLDLLSAPSRSSITGVLTRFWGFHSVWEPGLCAWPRVFAFMGPRSRLPQLRTDLAALGLGDAELDAIPRFAGASSLLQSEASAVGSAYVMEGSTLGGQLIARALSAAAWAPDDGIAYFNPYGASTGPMWRGFKAWADALLGDDAHEAAADSAVRTFTLLEQWLTA